MVDFSSLYSLLQAKQPQIWNDPHMKQGCLLKNIQNFPSICGDTKKYFQHLQVQAANHNQWLYWQGWKSPLHLPIALWDWFHPFWSFYRWWINVSLLWNLVIRLLISSIPLLAIFFLYACKIIEVFSFWSVLFFLNRPQKRKSHWLHVNSSFERWTFTAAALTDKKSCLKMRLTKTVPTSSLLLPLFVLSSNNCIVMLQSKDCKY